jgi:hypothetical protein
MNCQNCHEIVEPGAAFCGNCGYPVQPAATAVAPPNAVPSTAPVQPAAPPAPAEQPSREPAVNNANAPAAPVNTAPQQPPTKVPSYAVATPTTHIGETQALLAVIFGIIGIVGSGFLVPIIGLAFGVAGLCMATVSRRLTHRRRLAVIGFVVAVLAVVSGFAALAYNAEHDKNTTPSSQTGQSDTSSKILSQLATPCYSFNLIDQYNVSNDSGSCNSTMFNGQNFADSSNIYKIVATKSDVNDPTEFTQLAKQAIDADIKTNLPTFTVTSEGPSSFAGGLAYTLYAIDKAQDTAVVETAVLHQTNGGSNVFDIVHAVNGTSVTLQTLESQWKWK